MRLEELKITYICRYVPGVNEILKSIHNGLEELGCTVQELNLTGKIPLLHNPYRHQGGNGPVYVRLNKLFSLIRDFQPDLILFGGGGLTFSAEDMAEIKQYCGIIGLTLSDPDVFPTVVNYASDYDFHTTNSMQALDMYREHQHDNIIFMPFAVDRRYFVPRDPVPQFQCDVAVIGHARPDRIALASRLTAEFDTLLYGKNWPDHTMGPVNGENWFRAAHSTTCLVNFPTTGAGYTNVKVGVFEATAAGKLLFTHYFDEMSRYFVYDKEIVGYRDEDDLIEKLRYYISHPAEADKVARAGQQRTRLEHTWEHRFADLFGKLDFDRFKGRKWA
ncbi:glycosyltransferase [Paenibacillus sp. GCM10012307]|uniref:Glycosyltransferase n=1 Tax=Paenibacillus roseus TaxID=2798579 RepID=A0A934J789_9BACL|nr:glycosyltransferase [Paenibacillus roseus]MBJ6363049.1 glycosyltransferase [Paenibacillus roseus]